MQAAIAHCKCLVEKFVQGQDKNRCWYLMASEAGYKIKEILHCVVARLIAAFILFHGAIATSSAQTLPAPSRSVYKCSINGVPTYSDAPCMGAQRLEIEPTRGVGKKSGHDVQQERYLEMHAEVLRPLTGWDAKQLDIYRRRTKLSPEIQHECHALDTQIPITERDEQKATAEQRAVIKASLFNLRLRQRELRC